jgi:hypothetical protein
VRIRHAFVLVAALALVASFGPAQASSAYHMNGQGTVTIPGGLPACLPVVNVPACSSPNNTFSWGNLTVQGFGVLQGHNVAGQYTCLSTETGVYESRIYGNTANYQLTFNFRCRANTVVDGPTYITGWFTNVVDDSVDALSVAYKKVPASHPGQPLLQKGAPTFAGYFFAHNTLNLDPDFVDAGNGDQMICNGGFAPNDPTQGTSITTAFFAGACTAVEA